MIELSKKYKCKLAAGDVCFVGEKDGFVFGTVGIAGGYSGVTGVVWDRNNGVSVGYHGTDFDLIEVKPSAIEEMIAWLEDRVQHDERGYSPYTSALTEARRIRDSNATSDE